MGRAIFCKSCGNMIASTDGGEIKIQHRGRIIRVHGTASVVCEKCGKETNIVAKNICRLCRDNAAVPASQAGNDGSV